MQLNQFLELFECLLVVENLVVTGAVVGFSFAFCEISRLAEEL